MGIAMAAGYTRLIDFHYSPNKTYDYETTLEQQLNQGSVRYYMVKRDRQLAVARGNNRMQTWGKHRTNAPEIWNLGHTDNSFTLGTSRGVTTDGRYVYVATGTKQIYSFDISTEPGTRGNTIGLVGDFSGNIRGLTFMGRYFWVGNDSNDVFKVHPETGRTIQVFNTGTSIADLCNDGRFIYCFSNRLINSDFIFNKFDPDTGEQVHVGRIETTMPSNGSAFGVDYVGDGHFVASYFESAFQQIP